MFARRRSRSGRCNSIGFLTIHSRPHLLFQCHSRTDKSSLGSGGDCAIIATASCHLFGNKAKLTWRLLFEDNRKHTWNLGDCCLQAFTKTTCISAEEGAAHASAVTHQKRYQHSMVDQISASSGQESNSNGIMPRIFTWEMSSSSLPAP